MWLREHIGSCDGHLGVNENFTTRLRRTLKGEQQKKRQEMKEWIMLEGNWMMQLEWNEIDLDGKWAWNGEYIEIS